MSQDQSRRNFLKNAAFASGGLTAAIAANPAAEAQDTHGATRKGRRPNILMICADQFRTDFVGANRENPSVQTPNIDALAHRGTNFCSAVCNQPLCSPSRASFLTGTTATEADVWKLGLEMNHSIPTIATTLKQAGYTTAFYGKWHVSSTGGNEEGGRQLTFEERSKDDKRGLVPIGPSRGGFDDVFEGANALETVSHPYFGNYWDTVGQNIGFKDVYRVDFITDRSIQFIERKHDKPWLMFVSQLEPHHQNDEDMMVPPKRYVGKYDNAFVPHDLRALPGNWQTHLPGYYGCVQAIDDCVGKLVDSLRKTGQLDNTIIVFFSDHGCTFKTRIGEYKRSPHDSSLRVPMIFAGPGFDRATVVHEVVSLMDLTPTLIDAAGGTVPANMRGKSLLPMVTDVKARQDWNSVAYVQISQSICGRAIRTRDWVYCAYDPTVPHGAAPFSKTYTDFALYSISADPHQLVNLVGREPYRAVCKDLREKLKQAIVAHGEPEPTITPMMFYA